ncbi:hypothetical protein I5H08_gp003 [Mycobacterium phage Yuna]|uniref:Uncharacterized protein n=1 Tax=Mycobacterium phage Yuna TaxID=2599885 RepID=A0A5J6TF42_9CAUD|nr:hypothetical protein I5H08_gp003 [Mycobacterium phage Yuna]QFG09386.1 hypothetical protein PBI_YUNA_3 [Mycobacterium phage Yuna]
MSADAQRRKVAVVASTLPQARALIDALGLHSALPVSKRTGARGLMLDALLIDETALPLTEAQWGNLVPALLPSNTGHVYELRRLSGPPPF